MYATVYKLAICPIWFTVTSNSKSLAASTVSIPVDGSILVQYFFCYIFALICASFVVFRFASPPPGRAAFTRLLPKYSWKLR